MRDLHKKQAVTSQSLQKIEDGRYPSLVILVFAVMYLYTATYAIVVRSAEYELLDEIVARSISDFDGKSKGRVHGEEE